MRESYRAEGAYHRSPFMRIHTIDLAYLGSAGMIAAYILEGPTGIVLIETGPANTSAALEQGLAEVGIDPADVRDVVVTHIHLDHAGAAWQWAARGATIHVHSFGAKHLVDPSRLLRSAERIYGERMIPLWGELRPCPADTVRPIVDGEVIRAGGLALRAIETPGHARHHHAIALEEEGICFPGDVAGMILPDDRFITVPTPPPEFDPIAWELSIDRLERESFRALYPTHFGAVKDVADHLNAVRHAVRDHHAFVRDRLNRGETRDEVLSEYRAWCTALARDAGVANDVRQRFLSPSLLAMNVDGILRYERDVKPLQSSPGQR